MWLNVRYGELPIAVGQGGSVISTATPDASGLISDVSADPTKLYNYEADNGRMHAEFSSKEENDASVRLSTDRGEVLSFGLAGTADVPRTISGNVIQFTPDANVEVRYEVLDDRVKEQIILKERPATNVFTFSFHSTGLNVVESAYGYHFYSSEGEEVFWLMRPTVASLGAVEGRSTFEISGSTMRLTIDQGFLDSAFYPVTVDPTVVGTSSNAAATAYSNNRKMLQTSDGRLVLFYQRGADIVYRSSSDGGAVWGPDAVASTSNSTQFGVTIDEDNHIYLSYLDDSAGSSIRFRKLTYEGSGIWSGGNQLAVESEGTTRNFPDIFREQGGRLWVAYRYFDGASYTIRAKYSDSSLPGWTEDGSVWSGPQTIAGPSTENRMYPSFSAYEGRPSLTYLYPTGAEEAIVVWRSRDGGGWSSEETVPGVVVPGATYPRFATVSTYDNDIHVAYSASEGIEHTYRDDATGNWSAPQSASSNAGDAFPALTTSGGGLHLFWSSYVGPNQRRLFRKAYNGSSWETNGSLVSPAFERTFDGVWTELAATPWSDASTDRDALFRFGDGSAVYGNEIGETYNAGYALDTPSKRSSVKFVADETGTATGLRLFVNRTGTAPTYRIGIQADATGYPDGNWLGGGVYVDAPNPGGGWNSFDIPDVQLAAGVTYHVVAEYVGGVIDDSNCARIAYVTPGLLPGEAITTFDGTAWSTMNATPAYVIEREGSTFEGQSIRGNTTYSLDSAGIRAGERFTPSTTFTPSSLEMRIARVGAPTGDLLVKIVEGGDNEIFSAVIATPGSPDTPAWLSTPVSGVTLSSGTAYRVFVTATGVDSANHYDLQLGLSAASSPYPELSWGGTTNTATTALSGSGFNDKTSASADRTVSDVPLFGSNGDRLYLGMTEPFDYAYFDLAVAASEEISPSWEYWNGAAWAPLTVSENPSYGFTSDAGIGFTPPGDWAPLVVNGEAAAKYYVRVTRQAASVGTSPIATQMTAVRNNRYATTIGRHAELVPVAWTEGPGTYDRVKYESFSSQAPEIAAAEARHIDKDTHTTRISWITNMPATSQIVYDTTSHAQGAYSDYAYSTSLDTSLVTTHLVTISGLTSDTVYFYRILSMNADGHLFVSDEHLIPPGDLTVDTDMCASCHRSHTAWRPETWTDSTDATHSGLLIRQP